MPRNMSFMQTAPQMRARTKTVTRRLGWTFLRPGEIIKACERARGLRREEIPVIALIRVVDVRREPLNAITREDCIKEGYPDRAPEDFIALYGAANRCAPDRPVTRIEFEFMDAKTALGT